MGFVGANVWNCGQHRSDSWKQDAHTLFWFAPGATKLSPGARSLLESFDSEVLVSAATAWETATKFRLGKLPGAEAFVMEFAARIDRPRFRQLAIGVEHRQRAGLLRGLTGAFRVSNPANPVIPDCSQKQNSTLRLCA
jgi:PIN domain nuclease of toxin-antitoxin system